jgi:hypothetical protein
MAICYINFHSWLFHGALVALGLHHQTTTPLCHSTNITTQKMIKFLGLEPLDQHYYTKNDLSF